MNPTQREIMLDLACSAEGFTRHDLSAGGPEYLPEDAHSFDVIEEDGTRRERLLIEDVAWWRVLAWKCEDRLGNPLDPEDDPEDWDGDHCEPEDLSDSGAGEPE